MLRSDSLPPIATDAGAAQLAAEIGRRRTFAIISHPDAGKTTLTEKLLLYGGAIHLAGTVKARRADRHATSDWMALEQERGISVTSSVMQFEYAGYVINLLDTPVFFGSALTNFGVEPFLQEFLSLAPPPGPREASTGLIEPERPAFSGFVFKIQANMDPKHRDRVAFVRVVSGRFEAGMQVHHARSGKPVRLASPQTFMARERTAVLEAWPGDVIGVMDRGVLRIGDTVVEDGTFEFQGIPRFAPEHFARVVLLDPLKRKPLDAGLRQLTEEGAAQVFYTSPTEVAGPMPIVGAVGQLQFDVMLHRLEHEYGVRCRLERLTARFPRWVTGNAEAIRLAARERGRTLLFDAKGQPLILFEDAWNLRWTLERATDIAYHEVAP